jgi:hypothetical protein
LLSANNLKEEIEQDCFDHPNLDKEAVIPKPEYMSEFLANVLY